MNAMTLKEYCKLNNLAKTTLLFHLEKLELHPCGSIQMSGCRPSYIWTLDNLNAAKNRIKHKMVTV